ncbi:MAG: hypothetical protein ACQESC_04850, partial [Nanobdellota archaeon]
MATKYILIISLLLLTLITVPLALAGVCVPSYIDNQGVTSDFSAPYSSSSSSCPPEFFLNESTDDPLETTDTGCCCRCIDTANSYQVMSFEAPQGYEHLVSTQYCHHAGY